MTFTQLCRGKGQGSKPCVEGLSSPLWPPSPAPWGIWMVELPGKEKVPWVLTDLVLGVCMDVHSLNKPVVITGLPAELLTAATLARILKWVGCVPGVWGHSQTNAETRQVSRTDSITAACRNRFGIGNLIRRLASPTPAFLGNIPRVLVVTCPCRASLAQLPSPHPAPASAGGILCLCPCCCVVCSAVPTLRGHQL